MANTTIRFEFQGRSAETDVSVEAPADELTISRIADQDTYFLHASWSTSNRPSFTAFDINGAAVEFTAVNQDVDLQYSMYDLDVGDVLNLNGEAPECAWVLTNFPYIRLARLDLVTMGRMVIYGQQLLKRANAPFVFRYYNYDDEFEEVVATSIVSQNDTTISLQVPEPTFGRAELKKVTFAMDVLPMFVTGLRPTATCQLSVSEEFTVVGALTVTPGTARNTVSGTWYDATLEDKWAIYWSLTPGVTKLSNRIETTPYDYQHTGLTPGVPVYYRIAYIRKFGRETELSNEVSSTPLDLPNTGKVNSLSSYTYKNWEYYLTATSSISIVNAGGLTLDGEAPIVNNVHEYVEGSGETKLYVSGTAGANYTVFKLRRDFAAEVWKRYRAASATAKCEFNIPVITDVILESTVGNTLTYTIKGHGLSGIVWTITWEKYGYNSWSGSYQTGITAVDDETVNYVVTYTSGVPPGGFGAILRMRMEAPWPSYMANSTLVLLYYPNPTITPTAVRNIVWDAAFVGENSLRYALAAAAWQTIPAGAFPIRDISFVWPVVQDVFGAFTRQMLVDWVRAPAVTDETQITGLIHQEWEDDRIICGAALPKPNQIDIRTTSVPLRALITFANKPWISSFSRNGDEITINGSGFSNGSVRFATHTWRPTFTDYTWGTANLIPGGNILESTDTIIRFTAPVALTVNNAYSIEFIQPDGYISAYYFRA